MPLQHGRNAAHVFKLVLQRTAPPSPRRAYMISSIWNYPAPTVDSLASTATSDSTTDTASSDPFLEDDAVEYDLQRTSLPEREVAARPIPWPTLFAPKDDDYNVGAGKISLEDELRACTSLYRQVLRKDYDGALDTLAKLQSAGVRIEPRLEYGHAATTRLHRNRPDKDGFLAFAAISPVYFVLYKQDVDAIRRKFTRDHDFIRRVIFEMASRQQMDERLMELVNHLILVAKPELSFATFVEALQKYDEAWLSNPTSEPPNELWQHHLWNTFVRHMIEVGYPTEAILLYDTLSERDVAIVWEDDTNDMIEGVRNPLPPIRRIPYDEEVDGQLSPVQLLAKRIRYTHANPIVPSDLVLILEAISQLSSTNPKLLERFRVRFIRPREMMRGDRKAMWQTAFAQRVWIQAEMMILRKKHEHKEVVSLFRGHCMWYGLPYHPAIKSAPAGVNSFEVELRPEIRLINSLLPSLFDIMPRRHADFSEYHAEYLDLAPRLNPAAQPNTHTHGVFTNFAYRHFGLDYVVGMLRETVKRGLPIGSRPFEQLVLAAAQRGALGLIDEILDAMESGKEWRGLPTEQPSPQFYRELRANMADYEAIMDTLDEETRLKYSQPTPSFAPYGTRLSHPWPGSDKSTWLKQAAKAEELDQTVEAYTSESPGLRRPTAAFGPGQVDEYDQGNQNNWARMERKPKSSPSGSQRSAAQVDESRSDQRGRASASGGSRSPFGLLKSPVLPATVDQAEEREQAPAAAPSARPRKSPFGLRTPPVESSVAQNEANDESQVPSGLRSEPSSNPRTSVPQSLSAMINELNLAGAESETTQRKDTREEKGDEADRDGAADAAQAKGICRRGRARGDKQPKEGHVPASRG